MTKDFTNSEVLARIDNLKMYLGKKKKLIINNTGFQVRRGEILGIIGESGSGKTILTSTLTGLNTKIQTIESGQIVLNNIDVTDFTFDDWNEANIRGRFVSQVFQNPLSSLNPYRKIGSQIIESILTNAQEDITKEEAHEEAIELLSSVKIHDPEEIMNMYPHQMSGGMNQRIVIVTILAAKPELIIFDEPTTALDPLAQAQIIEIIREIRDATNVGMIFISHDIALVSSIADTIAIMYAGKIIEQGSAKEIINYPLHPYTWGLLMSIPEMIINQEERLFSIRGTVPNDIKLIKGDAFAPRSDYALAIDSILKPLRVDVSPTHFVYSWLYNEQAPAFNPPKIIKNMWKEWQEKNPDEILFVNKKLQVSSNKEKENAK